MRTSAVRLGKDAAGKGLSGGTDDVVMEESAAAVSGAGAAAAGGEEDDDELKKALAMSMEVEAGSAERCGIGLPSHFRGLCASPTPLTTNNSTRNQFRGLQALGSRSLRFQLAL